MGNVYIKFVKESSAKPCVESLNNRWYNGAPIKAELSPVTDFREACCRQYEMGECTRAGFCNFMHLKPISRDLRRELYSRQRGDGVPKRKSRKEALQKKVAPGKRTPGKGRQQGE